MNRTYTMVAFSLFMLASTSAMHAMDGKGTFGVVDSGRPPLAHDIDSGSETTELPSGNSHLSETERGTINKISRTVNRQKGEIAYLREQTENANAAITELVGAPKRMHALEEEIAAKTAEIASLKTTLAEVNATEREREITRLKDELDAKKTELESAQNIAGKAILKQNLCHRGIYAAAWFGANRGIAAVRTKLAAYTQGTEAEDAVNFVGDAVQTGCTANMLNNALYQRHQAPALAIFAAQPVVNGITSRVGLPEIIANSFDYLLSYKQEGPADLVVRTGGAIQGAKDAIAKSTCEDVLEGLEQNHIEHVVGPDKHHAVSQFIADAANPVLSLATAVGVTQLRKHGLPALQKAWEARRKPRSATPPNTTTQQRSQSELELVS